MCMGLLPSRVPVDETFRKTDASRLGCTGRREPTVAIGSETPTPTDVLVAEAIDLMRGARVAVLTGAGVSTDSGIPDYRGEGAPVRTPMTVQTFLASEAGAQALLGRKPPRLAQLRGGAAQPRPPGARAARGRGQRRGDHHAERRRAAPPCRRPPRGRVARQHGSRGLPAVRAALRPAGDRRAARGAQPVDRSRHGDPPGARRRCRGRRRRRDGDPRVHGVRRRAEARRRVLRRVRAGDDLPGCGRRS